MSNMCLVPTPAIRELADKIRLAYPEACERNAFSNQMCAEWVGLYNDLNNINNPDSIPSMKSLINTIEKQRNKEGKSFLRDLKEEERQRAIEQEMQSIKEKALADGTFMKAPNGKDTNLTERQWLQVRTKAFKKWFGDWTKAHYGNVSVDIRAPRDADGIPTEQRIYLDGKVVGYLPHYKGKIVIPSDTTVILKPEYRNKGIAKKAYIAIANYYKSQGITFKSDDYLSKDAIRLWESLVRDGYARKTFENLKDNDEFLSIDESHYRVSYEFINDNIPDNLDSTVSKVVDENGEPLVVYHHTNDPNLDKFSTDFENYFAKDGGTKEAIFFDEEKTGTLNRKYDLPVFLNIKELNEYNETKKQLHDRGTTYREVVNNSAKKNNRTGGVHMKDFDDNKKEHQSIWIIHNPNQVKSATDNNGEFSNENDSILASPQAYEEIPVEILSEMADKEASRTAYDSVESSDSDLDKKFGNKTDITVSELLDNLLKSETPFSEFVKALKDNIGEIGNIQVKLVPNSNSKVYGLGGLYSTLDNTIYINRNAQFKGKDGKVDNTILHEIVHAIVANSLNTAEHREELGKIFDEAKEKILKKYGVESFDELPEYLRKGRLYGLQNLDEFAAEFFTNSEFILELNDENTFGKRSEKQSIISKLVEWIKSLLSKGVTETYKRSGEILEDIILNSGGTIQTNRNLLAGNSSAANTQQQQTNISEKVQTHQGNWSRQEAQNNPRILYVFTDNTDRDSGSGIIPENSWYSKKYGKGHHYPTMTAAVVRGLDNARPISTQRWYHQGAKGNTGRWTDANVEEFKTIIREELQEIANEFNTGKYDTIMFPSGDGLFNTNISNITKQRTPQLYQALADLLHEFGFDNLIPSDVIPSTQQQQSTLPGPETKINIYSGTGENADLSNFAERPFKLTPKLENELEEAVGFTVFGDDLYSDTVIYNSVEQAFQDAKIAFAYDGTQNAIDDDTADRISKSIRKANSAEAKRIGKTIPMSKLAIENWDKNSSKVMKILLKESFKQNPQALQRLLATGNAILTHTQDKGKWGTEFPRLLMEVRDELRVTSQQQPTSTIEPRFKQGIETLAGYYEGGGRLLTDDFPGVPEELDDKLDNHFMGGEELSDDDYRELAKYISVVQNTDANTSQSWPYIAVPKQQIQQQSKFNISQAEFYSGDAMGSDRAWAREARKLGIKVTDYTVGNWDVLPQSEKDKYDKEYREVANQMGRKILDANSYNGRLVRRDMMQADSADAIFAIGTIDSRGYVDGGTGYATTRGIIRNIPVYVYDRRNKQWKIWSTNSRKFIPIPEPTLTPHAAVIGTRGDVIGKDPRGYDIRDIKEEEKQVIRNILVKTVGQQSQQVQQQPTQQQTTTTPTQEENDNFADLIAQPDNTASANIKNLPVTQGQVTQNQSIPRPISPSFETALKVPESREKEFYNTFSPEQIVDRGKMIKNMFADIIDETIYERRLYFNDIINDSDTSAEDKQKARESLEVYEDPILARVAAVDYMTYSAIMEQIKEDLATQAEYSQDDVTRQKLENTVKFFDLLSNEASKWIEEEEGIRKGSNNTSEDAEQDEEDFGDNEEGQDTNGNEGFVNKNRFNNPFRELSKQVRRTISGIETGQTDDLGNTKTYTSGFIYSALMSYLSKNVENADDFMTLTRPDDYEEGMLDIEGLEVTKDLYPKGYPSFPMLEQMRSKYPWADQVIARLVKDWRAKDEEEGTQLKFPPTYGALASLFYTNFFNAFIPYAKIQVGMDANGNPYYGTTPLNYDMEDRSQRDALETSYNNGITYSDDSLYNTDKTLNNENAKKVSKALDDLLHGDKLSSLYTAYYDEFAYGYEADEEYRNRLAEITNFIKAFGINMTEDNVRSLLLEGDSSDTLRGLLTDLRGIANQVASLSKDKNYFIDVVNQYGKSIWDDFFKNRGFVTEVNYMQSFYDPAAKKTRYSYSKDNKLQKTMRFLFSDNIPLEKRREYLNEHYGKYEWFRDQSAPEGTGWKSLWLEDAWNGRGTSKDLPYKNINSIDDSSGTQRVIREYGNWTAADKYRVMTRSWDTGSGDFAYYLAPIFADSPMCMTVRGPKYSMNELIEGTYDAAGNYIPSGFIRLIDQELKRIKYVTEDRKKAILEGKILPIANYEKNGAKFNFMPELNERAFVPEGNMTFLQYVVSLKETGAGEEAIRNAEIEAIHRVLERKYYEFLDAMPGDVKVELGGSDMSTPEEMWNKFDVAYYNMVYADAQIVATTVIDPAFLKNGVDFLKRFKEVYASGARANTNSLYGKKTERVLLVADENITSPSYKNIEKVLNRAGNRLSAKDRQHILNYYTFLKDKDLDGINVSDAQALRSLSSMRSILDMYGKWNARLEAAYNRFKNWEWNREDFDIILQTLKPFVFSVIEKNDGLGGKIPVPVQHKNSELVLLAMYDMISGSLRNSEKLKGVNRFLEDVKDSDGNPIADMVLFESAGKSGNQGVININYSHKRVMDTVRDGAITIYNEKSKLIDHTIYLDSKFKNNTRENTADNFDLIKTELTHKLIDGKISQLVFNQCMSFFNPTADEVVEILTTYATIKDNTGNISINPERVLEVPFEDYMEALPTPPHHMEAQAPLGSQGRNIIVADLPDTFQLTLDGKDNNKQTLGKEDTIDFYYSLIIENLLQDYAELKEVFKDNKSLEKKVKQLASTNPTYGRNFSEAFSLNTGGKFNLSPNSPNIFRKVLQLVNSVIKNSISVQKVDGAALIQASGIGLRDDLNLVFDENGKLIGAECYLPATHRSFFEAFTKKRKVNGQEIEYLDEEALRKAGLDLAIGYRIPTENKSSMLPIIIKGFSPQQNGSAIFLPAEITTLSGSDFDVDKMFVMLSSFFVQRYDMREAREDYAKENKMLDSIFSLFSHSELAEDIMEEDPEGFKEWFERNKEKYLLKKPRIVKYKYDFSKTPKQNGRKARNNMLVQIMYNILTSQEGAEAMFNPQNFEDVKEASKMMKIINTPNLLRKYKEKYSLTDDTVGDHLYNASKEDLIDFVKENDEERSPIYPLTFNYFHEQNMAGDALLAMFALQVSAAAKFQRAEITIKPKNQFTVNGRKIKDVDRIMNGLGEHRLKNVSQFVGACADNGKDPNVTDYGATRQNAKVVAYLLRAGLSIKEASLIINQPLMSDLKAAWDIAGKKQYWNDSNVTTDMLLKAKLQPGKLTEGEERAIAIMCLKIAQQADILGELTSMSRADSPNGGLLDTFAKARLYKYKVDLFNGKLNTFDFPFENISAAISNTKINLNESEDQIREKLLAQKMSMLQGFYSLGVQSFDHLLSPFFFMLGDKFDNMITKNILNNLPADMSDEKKVRIIDALYNDYITFALSGSALFGDETDDATLKNKREYYLKQFPNDYRQVLIKNPDIRDAIGNIIAPDRRNRLVLKDGGQLAKGQRDEVMRRITSLMYSDNPDANKLAKDLIIYSFFDNGLQFTADSFSTMLSTLLLLNIEGYNDVLENIGHTLTKENVEKFIDQFFNNHPEIAVNADKIIKNTDLVSDIEIVIDKHHNTKFDNPLKSNLEPYFFINYKGTLYYMSNYNYDFITYRKLSRFGDSSKLYNINKNNNQMAQDFQYTTPVLDDNDFASFMAEMDEMMYMNPDFNDGLASQVPQENPTTPTNVNDTVSAEDNNADIYHKEGEEQIGLMC